MEWHFCAENFFFSINFHSLSTHSPSLFMLFPPLCRYLLHYLTITAGEHDLSVTEEEEQTLPVKYIILHPKFNPRKPMDYDIALLKVDGNFKYGNIYYLLF